MPVFRLVARRNYLLFYKLLVRHAEVFSRCLWPSALLESPAIINNEVLAVDIFGHA